MMKRIVPAVACFVYVTTFCSTVKDQEEIFSRLTKVQNIYKHLDAGLVTSELSSEYPVRVNIACESLHEKLNSLSPELLKVVDSISKNLADKELHASLMNKLETDIFGFLNFLKENGLATDVVNKEEESVENSYVLDASRDILELFVLQSDKKRQGEHLFSIANNMFEYAFGEQTFPQFVSMFNEKINHPLVRFLYSNIWWNMSGTGWRSWNQDCLDKLKQESALGKEIVYIAGGGDIFQLIKNGIYKIRLIDPYYPTQPKYYPQGAGFLVYGEDKNPGIGDEITFNFDDKKISMHRVGYKEDGSFPAMVASGQEITIPRSSMLWMIYDAQKVEPLGYVEIERRFCNQEDFKFSDTKEVLVSFNELYYLTTPRRHGWGIDAEKFDPNFKLYVKQLSNPVSYQVACNMKTIEGSMQNYNFVNLLQLGTCIN